MSTERSTPAVDPRELSRKIPGVIAIGRNIQPALKELRLKNELTQDVIAKRAGISQSTVNYIENGKSDPEIINLDKHIRAIDPELRLALLATNSKTFSILATGVNEIASQIRRLREELGSDQTRAAGRINRSQSWMSELETLKVMARLSKLIKGTGAIDPGLIIALIDGRA